MVNSNSVTQESRELVYSCYKLQEKTSEFITKQEVASLARELQFNVAIFTAADFFDLNKSTLFGILATITTYFIVIIQFVFSMTVSE